MNPLARAELGTRPSSGKRLRDQRLMAPNPPGAAKRRKYRQANAQAALAYGAPQTQPKAPKKQQKARPRPSGRVDLNLVQKHPGWGAGVARGDWAQGLGNVVFGGQGPYKNLLANVGLGPHAPEDYTTFHGHRVVQSGATPFGFVGGPAKVAEDVVPWVAREAGGGARAVLNRATHGLIDSPEKKFAQRQAQNIRLKERQATGTANLMVHLEQHTTQAEKYALASVHTSTPPRQWAEFFDNQAARWAKRAANAKTEATKYRFRVRELATRRHAEGFRSAQHLVTDDGRAFADSASLKLKQASELMQRSEILRQKVLRDAGVPEENIVERVRSQGRLARGARYHGATKPKTVTREGWEQGPGGAMVRTTHTEEIPARPAGWRGAEDFQPGEQATRLALEKGFPGEHARALPRRGGGSWRPGAIKGPPGRPPSFTKVYKGRVEESGEFTSNFLTAAARSLRESGRFARNDEIHRMLISVSRRTRPDTGDWVAVARKSPSQLQREDVNRINAVVEAAQSGSEKSFRRAVQDEQDEVRNLVFPKHPENKNVVWVPREVAGVAEQTLLAGRLSRWMIAEHNKWVNGAISIGKFASDLTRASILALNPAYILPNFIGATAQHIIEAGFLAPKYLSKAFMLYITLGNKEVTKIEKIMVRTLGAAQMGEGPTEIVGHFIGPAKALNRVTSTVGAITDRVPRLASFLYQASKEGYKTRAEIIKLLSDPALSDKLAQVTKKALDEMIDFENLNDLEKGVLRNAIFVYPWLKGSLKYTLTFPKRHKLATLGVGGVAYYQHETKPSGPGSTFLLKIPGTNSYISPNQLFPGTTWASIAQDLYGAATGDPTANPLTSYTNPLAGAVVQGLQGYDWFHRKQIPQGLPGIYQELKGEVPLVQRVQAIGETPQESKRHLRTYNQTEKELRPVLGTLTPSGWNQSLADQITERDRRAALHPVERRIEDHDNFAVNTLKEARRLGYDGKALPPEVAQAIEWDKQRSVAYAKLRGKLKVRHLTQLQMLDLDLRVLFDNGKITQDTVKKFMALARKHKPAQIAYAREHVIANEFGLPALWEWGRRIRAAGGAWNPPSR